jgi:NAD-dependent dihydropyrimidine dehydrogenase PreA subunit
VVKLNEEMCVLHRRILLCHCSSAYIYISNIFIYFNALFCIASNSLNDYSIDEKQQIVDSCPTNVFEFDPTAAGGGTVMISRETECIFCRECTYLMEDFRKAPEDPLGVSVEHSADRFTFTVETNGSLLAKDVVMLALRELREKLGRLHVATFPLLKAMGSGN